MARRRPEETKQVLLDAGRRLVDRGVTEGLTVAEAVDGLRSIQVVNEAGLRSPAMINHHWQGIENYRAELCIEIVRTVALTDIHEDPSVLAATSPTEMVRQASNRVLETMLADPSFPMYLQLVGRSTRNHDLRRAIGKFVDENMGVVTHQIYEPFAALMDLEFRPPFTTRDLAVTIQALTDGFASLGVAGQDVTAQRTWRGTDGWTLHSIAVDCIQRAMHQPRPPTDRQA